LVLNVNREAAGEMEFADRLLAVLAQRSFAMPATYQDASQEEIARRAYELWQARGCPPGDGTEDWERAVAELTSGHRRNGSIGGLADWLARLRKKITGRDM
jgi:hypothetical protein